MRLRPPRRAIQAAWPAAVGDRDILRQVTRPVRRSGEVRCYHPGLHVGQGHWGKRRRYRSLTKSGALYRRTSASSRICMSTRQGSGGSLPWISTASTYTARWRPCRCCDEPEGVFARSAKATLCLSAKPSMRHPAWSIALFERLAGQTVLIDSPRTLDTLPFFREEGA
jgi:hypothetical protein